MLAQLIRSKNEQRKKALLECRALSTKIAETKAASKPTTELDAEFKKWFDEAEGYKVEVEQLEAQQTREASVNAALESLNRPNPLVTHRRGNEESDPEPRATIVQTKDGALVRGNARFRDIHVRAFDLYLREDDRAARALMTQEGIGPTEMHILLGTQGDLGGFLVPEDRRAVVLKDKPGIAVIRRMARVEPTGSDTLVFPTIQSNAGSGNAPIMYTSGFVGAWKSQGYVSGGTAPPTQDAPKFGQTRIPVQSWQPAAVELSQELIADSGANVVGIVEQAIAETFGLDEDYEYINGTGSGRPLGILSDTRVSAVNSGSATTLTYDGLLDLYATLAGQYRANATWLMNSLCYATVLKLKDNQAYPIFTPNMNVNQLWGRPLVTSEWMPNIAGSATPIIFGDFSEYIIADREGVRVQRLTERFAPNLGILPTARVGGQVSRAAAFKKQNIST